MPFGKYKNAKDCMMQNKDKKDPSAYCAMMMKRMEGENVKINFVTTIENYQDVQENTTLKGIMVNGTAIKEVTSRNGVKYLAKELEKATPSLRGKPILKDHQNNVDSIVGKVIESTYDIAEKAIKFKGVVTDEKVKTLILNGLLNHVSIGASVKKMHQEESQDGESLMVAEGIEILELSVTPVPGVQAASISAGEGFAMALQESYNSLQNEVSESLSQKTEIKENEEEPEMSEETIKIAKEAMSNAVLAFDKKWKKEDLMSFTVESLKILLEKAQAEHKIEEVAQPKGMVTQETHEPQPEKRSVIEMPVGVDEALKGIKAGTLVVERSTGGKASYWKMPDYKKFRIY